MPRLRTAFLSFLISAAPASASGPAAFPDALPTRGTAGPTAPEAGGPAPPAPGSAAPAPQVPGPPGPAQVPRAPSAELRGRRPAGGRKAPPAPGAADFLGQAAQGSTGYRDLARALEAQGKGFSEVFAALCGRLARRSGEGLLGPRWEAAAMFLGIARWTSEGGRPLLQGREDLALHFAWGGTLASAFGASAAEEAALERERRNAAEPGNAFDLDDYGASLLAVRWVGRLGPDRKEGLAWASRWARGERSLEHLPPLAFGRLPPGRVALPSELQPVRELARRAMSGT